MQFKALLTLSLLGFALSAFAQRTNIWTPITEKTLQASGEKLINAKKYTLLELDISRLNTLLQRAPQESFDTKISGAKLALPSPEGRMQEFYIFESSVMHPELARRYPEIKSYIGVGVDNPARSLRFDVSPAGFRAMVMEADHSVYLIDPALKGDTRHYMCYFKKDCTPKGDFTCFDEDHDLPQPGKGDKGKDCGTLRLYDLALAATGEYTAYFGTVAATLASLNTLVNRINVIYEREIRVRLQLVANNDLIIFTNPATDPYTATNIIDFVYENQPVCDDYIGTEHYDIGHAVHKYSSNNGGGAVGGVCSGFAKATAGSRHVDPVGDPFVVDYVSHEMGHQFSAKHAQNTTTNCNEYLPTAFEPGSGSTIMGYSGVCAPNVQINTDDYFQRGSLDYIEAFLDGSTCPDLLFFANNAPTVDAGPDRVFPKNTPFILTAEGSDADNDPLTYCWEQMDNEELTTTPPQNTETGGPAFRSFPPASSSSRWFPRLADVLANISPTWEVLPNVTREMNFAVTLRDNYVEGGCSAQDATLIKIDGNSGPFTVTWPNYYGLSFCGGSNTTVTWNVANTNLAPVSCPNVDILLSTDGGLSFPIVLKSAAPNTGSSTVTMPLLYAANCRIMVRAQYGGDNRNVFYDVSDADFLLCTATVSATPTANLQYICYGQSFCYTFNDNPCLSGFTAESRDPNLTITTIGTKICFSSTLKKKRTATVKIVPTGACGSGPAVEWTIFIDYPGNCGAFQPQITEREESSEPGTGSTLMINRKSYVFESAMESEPSEDHPVQLDIYDVQGKLCFSHAYGTSMIEFDPTGLPAGILILKISYQGQQLSDKILNIR